MFLPSLTRTLALPLAAAALLAACGETKLISGRSAPDETQVVDGPKLVLPPNFDLRPPREAQDYESVLRAQKNAEARQLITGGAVSGTVTSSVGEVPAADAWLLQKAGRVDENIRAELDVTAEEEAAEAKAKRESTFWHRWFGSKDEE